jgi:hypothetical protein
MTHVPLLCRNEQGVCRSSHQNDVKYDTHRFVELTYTRMFSSREAELIS